MESLNEETTRRQGQSVDLGVWAGTEGANRKGDEEHRRGRCSRVTSQEQAETRRDQRRHPPSLFPAGSLSVCAGPEEKARRNSKAPDF